MRTPLNVRSSSAGNLTCTPYHLRFEENLEKHTKSLYGTYLKQERESPADV